MLLTFNLKFIKFSITSRHLIWFQIGGRQWSSGPDVQKTEVMGCVGLAGRCLLHLVLLQGCQWGRGYPQIGSLRYSQSLP